MTEKNEEGFEFEFFHNGERIYGLEKGDDGFDNIYINTDIKELLPLIDALEKCLKTANLFIKNSKKSIDE